MSVAKVESTCHILHPCGERVRTDLRGLEGNLDVHLSRSTRDLVPLF